jgi:hypothetical protein
VNFKASVISGVLSTLIAAMITWLFGFWGSMWTIIGDTFSIVWAAIAQPIPVPLGLLVALGAGLGYLINRLRSASPQSGMSEVDSSAAQSIHDQLELSENEIAVIKVLSAADGRMLGIEHISSRIHASRLMTEQALERLATRKLLLESINYIHGASFRLSPIGRDFAIDKGFVK